MSVSNIIAVPDSVDGITKPWVLQVFNNIDPEVNITQVDITGPIGEGHGISSDLVALVAIGNKSGKVERYSLVVKLTNFRWMEVVEHMSLEDYLVFDVAEVNFYSLAVPDFLPFLVERLESKGKIKDFDKLCCINALPVPKCYFAASDHTSKKSVRVLENLKSQGYSIKPYPQPFGLEELEEMKLAVGALAQVHGLSHLLELRSGTPLPDRYDWIVDIYTCKQQWYYKYYQEGLKNLASAFPEHEQLLACLRKVDGVAMVREAVENPARVKVLCHADCWNNNIMFKYEDGKPKDVKLVDWQLVAYRPPTFDLVVLFMYQTWDIFHNHRDAILEHYHQELQKTLGENKVAGLQLYTQEQLEADFRADFPFAVYERIVYEKGLIPRQKQDLLLIIQQLKEWGVI